MSRLIDADAFMKDMYHRAFETDGDTMWQSDCWVLYRAIEQPVKEQPTIEPARKKGKWAYTVTHYPYCSECGWMPEEDEMRHMNYDFCPGCGSDMREEGGE